MQSGAPPLSPLAPPRTMGRLLHFGLGAALLGCGTPEIVVPSTLTLEVQPPHGSAGISTRVEGLVRFSAPVRDDTAVEQGIALECLGAPPCDAPVPSGCPSPAAVARVTYDPSAQLAHVKADRELLGNTCYAYVIEAGIAAADPNIGPLAFALRSSFQTR